MAEFWKTSNANAARPTWQPLTDSENSSSIGALAFDPTDTSHRTLVAGIGRFSNLAGIGGGQIGLLRTTDAGDHWAAIDGGGILKDHRITGVAPRGNTIVIASDRGVYRGPPTGSNWIKVSGRAGTGLPDGSALALASDPGNPARLFTHAGSRGIYRSLDTGATWTKVSNAVVDQLLARLCTNVPRTRRCGYGVKISLGPNNSVYVGVVIDSDQVQLPGFTPLPTTSAQSQLAGVFRSGDGGNTWTALDLPRTVEGENAGFGLHVGGQGGSNFSMVADRNNANVVYLGGDRQPAANEADGRAQRVEFPNSVGARDFTGRIFRVDASRPRGSQASHLTHTNTASHTAPHADSRAMAVAANGDLIQVDDGGIYRRTRPLTNTGDWSSMNGNLQVTEFHSVAWDANAKVIIGGAQDNGVLQQFDTTDIRWQNVSRGDGGYVVVDDISTPGYSIRYGSSQNLGGFYRFVYDANNAVISVTFPTLPTARSSKPTLDGGAPMVPQFYSPVVLNKGDPNRLVIGAANAVYESLDQGDSFTEIGPNIQVNWWSQVAYGAADNPDILYVGAGKTVYVRTGGHPTPLLESATFPQFIMGIALDPDNSRTAYVVDALKVYRTTNAGESWTDVTGNLAPADPFLRTIAYAPDLNGGTVIVGTNTGIFAASGPTFFNWSKLGTGFPAVPIAKLQYSIVDKVLVAGTTGRGAWTLEFNKGP